VSWAVEIGDEFEPEFDALHADVQTEILPWHACFSSSDRNSGGLA